MRINEDIDGWIVIGLGPGLRQLAFQRAADWIPPGWPEPACPQQMHLDIHVSDADQANRNCGHNDWVHMTASRASGTKAVTGGSDNGPSGVFT